MKKSPITLILSLFTITVVFANEVSLIWQDPTNDPAKIGGYIVLIDQQPFNTPSNWMVADQSFKLYVNNVFNNPGSLEDLGDLSEQGHRWVKTGTNYSLRISQQEPGEVFFAVQAFEKVMELKSDNTTNDVSVYYPAPVTGTRISVD